MHSSATTVKITINYCSSKMKLLQSNVLYSDLLLIYMYTVQHLNEKNHHANIDFNFKVTKDLI